MIKATILLELVLYLANILSAATITAAVRSANRDTIPSKPPTRQLVLPLAAFAAAFFAVALSLQLFSLQLFLLQLLLTQLFLEQPLLKNLCFLQLLLISFGFGQLFLSIFVFLPDPLVNVPERNITL
jgi:hypothetical protein